METGGPTRYTAEHAAHDAAAHARARRPRLRDTDVVPHQGVAPDGAALPELSLEALHESQHPHLDDADGWYYEQPPFDLGWVLGPDGFDVLPADRARRRAGTRAAPVPEPPERPSPRDHGQLHLPWT